MENEAPSTHSSNELAKREIEQHIDTLEAILKHGGDVYKRGVIMVIAFVFCASVLTSFLTSFLGFGAKHEPPIQAQVEQSLKQLQQDSSQSLVLLTKVQEEITARRKAMEDAEEQLNALRQQRTALELTDAQKAAIQSLVRRQPTVKEILTSMDFWVGRVLVSMVFLILGIAIGRWMRRFEKASPNPT